MKTRVLIYILNPRILFIYFEDDKQKYSYPIKKQKKNLLHKFFNNFIKSYQKI